MSVFTNLHLNAIRALELDLSRSGHACGCFLVGLV
jgi:hypothetical protein